MTIEQSAYRHRQIVEHIAGIMMERKIVLAHLAEKIGVTGEGLRGVFVTGRISSEMLLKVQKSLGVSLFVVPGLNTREQVGAYVNLLIDDACVPKFILSAICDISVSTMRNAYCYKRYSTDLLIRIEHALEVPIFEAHAR